MATRFNQSGPESFHESLPKADSQERERLWGSLSLQKIISEAPVDAVTPEDAWTPSAKKAGIPKDKPTELSLAARKEAINRDLRVLGNPFVRAKTRELIMENPDTPFNALSQVTLGGVSEAGLSHVAHQDIAKWALRRKRPAIQDAGLRARHWMDRPKQSGPSRFQQEFLKRQAQEQEHAQQMDALRQAFSQLKLSD
jgi:hypothetical protein